MAKFVPGLNFAAPPLAGILGVSSLRSLIFDSFASILWAGGYMSLGYLFSGRFERVAAYNTQLGAIPVVAVIAATAAGFKLLRGHGPLVSRRAKEASPAKRSQCEPQATRATGACMMMPANIFRGTCLKAGLLFPSPAQAFVDLHKCQELIKLSLHQPQFGGKIIRVVGEDLKIVPPLYRIWESRVASCAESTRSCCCSRNSCVLR